MKKSLLCVLLFSAFISGCDNVKSYFGMGKDQIASDSIFLQKLHDSIVVHSQARDSAYCDSMLVRFNSPDLAKQHPRLVARAFGRILSSHYNHMNPFVINEFSVLANKSGNDYLKAWYNYYIGRFKHNTENYKEAIQFLLAALAGFEKYKDTFGLIGCNRRLGQLYRFNAGDYNRAIFHFKRNLQITNDSTEVSIALEEIQISYKESNRPDSALHYLKLIKEFNYQGGNLFINLYIYHCLDEMAKKTPGSEDSVKKYFRLFTDMHTTEKNYRALIYGHVEYALALAQLKRERDAEYVLNQALKYTTACTDCQKENVELYDMLYKTYDSLGRNSKALKYLKLKDEAELTFSADKLKAELKSGEENFRFKQEQQALKLDKEKKDIQLSSERKQKSYLLTGLIVLFIFTIIFFIQRNRISKGKRRSDELLLNILPREVAEELKAKGSTDAKQFDDVTVMFTDFRDFTQISEKLTPAELVAEIDFCFKAFDNIISKYKIEKIKTIGDSYMCAGGLPVPNKTHAFDVVTAAIEIQQFINEYFQQSLRNNKPPFEIRIGIHTGPVVAGIVGLKKFAYDIWGDTVNIASRMESSGEAGKINISETTFELVKNKFNCTYRGKIHAKHKGEIDMYFVESLL